MNLRWRWFFQKNQWKQFTKIWKKFCLHHFHWQKIQFLVQSATVTVVSCSNLDQLLLSNKDLAYIKVTNTGKLRCGAAKHFLECYTSEGKFDNLKIQLIESMNVPDIFVEQKLWQQEKYWQAQLFTSSHRVNSPSDWYCLNSK